jgi:hypothetical protein
LATEGTAMKRKPRKTPLQLARAQNKRLRAEVAELRDELARYDDDYREPVVYSRPSRSKLGRILEPAIRAALKAESERPLSPLLEIFGMGEGSRPTFKPRFSYDVMPSVRGK